MNKMNTVDSSIRDGLITTISLHQKHSNTSTADAAVEVFRRANTPMSIRIYVLLHLLDIAQAEGKKT